MEELVTFAYCDLAGLVRGRAVPVVDYDRRRLSGGVGWVPANQAICCFGPLAEPNPWGSVGDRRLIADPATHVRVDLWPGVSALNFVLCDATHTDASPWEACPRTLLRDALATFESETGLSVVTAFEHEFQLLQDTPAEGPFTLAAQRAVEPFGPMVVAALREAGCEPEMFLPEYGRHQFEVLCRPAPGMTGADRAVVVKEVVREVARRLGRATSFAPLTDPAGIGNGVHVHISLLAGDGRTAMHDAARPAGLSAVAGSFAAGVLHHLPALLALTAPSAISYARLSPHHWSAGTAALGNRNREAALRIPAVVELEGHDSTGQLHLEFRGADATACPHLVLAALVLAGLEGIRAGRDAPPLLERDPSDLAPEELAALGLRPIPGTLKEALAALEADGVARGWLPEELYACYRSLKQAELAEVAGLDLAGACARYATVH
jgi:glutamine synthetase